MESYFGLETNTNGTIWSDNTSSFSTDFTTSINSSFAVLIRDENQRPSLEKLFNEICAMEDTGARTKKEKAFQKQLADSEGYVSYLQGRMKI